MSKIGIGIIGLRRGKSLAMEVQKNCPDAEIRAVFDVNQEVCGAVAAELNAPCAAKSADELVSRDDVDAVIVATPDHFHAENTVKAFEAGKHVYCEKPLAPTLEECKQMLDAAERAGKKFMVGQNYRYMPRFRIPAEMALNGELGELYMVESDYWNNLEQAKGVGGWRNDPKIRHPFMGGCHALDLTRYVAGEVVEVFAYANHKVYLEQPTDDCIIAELKFESGCLGRVLVSSGCKRPFLTTLNIYGSTGSVERGELSRAKNDPFIPLDIPEQPQQSICADFVRCIIDDTPEPISGLDGTRTVLACLAVIESAAAGNPVGIDNDKLEILTG